MCEDDADDIFFSACVSRLLPSSLPVSRLLSLPADVPHGFYVKWKLLNVNGISTALKNLSTYNENVLAVKEQGESDPVLGCDAISDCLFEWPE